VGEGPGDPDLNVPPADAAPAATPIPGSSTPFPPVSPSRSFWSFAWKYAAALEIVLALPYIAALALTPHSYTFTGMIYNPDDPYVYLSWMRQAVDGRWLFRNLFTLEPQRGLYFHVLFLFLGKIAGVTHTPLTVVYHLSRVVLGIVLCLELGALARTLSDKIYRQRWMLVFITLASGLGWTFCVGASPLLSVAQDLTKLPTDLWMTETVPFLSMLLNPLFVCAYCLLLGTFLLMIRGEREGRMRWAAAAGVCALLLGNIHSYDVLILNPVWVVYLLALSARPDLARTAWPGWRRSAAWRRYVVMGFISCPSVAYQWWTLQNEPVFKARALVPTLSPPVEYFLLGVGLLLPLAVLGFWQRRRDPVAVWLAIWCALGLALPYFPLSFQWKLSFALDLPYLALASIPVGGWIERARRYRVDAGRAAGIAFITVGFLSNACFLGAILQLLVTNQSHVPPPLYVDPADYAAIQWLRKHHHTGATVLSLPSMGNLIPADTGDAVYVGHWGETADFKQKLQTAARFFSGGEAPDTALAFLRANGIDYVFDGPNEQRLAAGQDPVAFIPGLSIVFRTPPGPVRATIYAAAPR